jgi:hypothetical protein
MPAVTARGAEASRVARPRHRSATVSVQHHPLQKKKTLPHLYGPLHHPLQSWAPVASRLVYGNGNRIVQAPACAFSYEMIHDTRVIYTDGRRTRRDGFVVPRDSRARWEGDELCRSPRI